MIELLLQWDITAFIWINSHNTSTADLLWGVVTHLGNGWVLGPIIIIMIATTFPRNRQLQVYSAVVLSMAMSGIVNWQVKSQVNRSRPVTYFASLQNPTVSESPDWSSAPYVVHVVGQRLRRNSFPSGHTNTAFSAAVVMIMLFGRRFYAAYGFAFMVAYSRVYVGAHFPLDTVVGGILGFGVTAACMLASRRLWKSGSGFTELEGLAGKEKIG